MCRNGAWTASLTRLISRSPEELSPVEAFELAVRLGRSAPWILRREVLEKALEEGIRSGLTSDQMRAWQRPPLPTGLGACWAAAVRKTDQYAALRPAVVLPLRWRKGGPPANAELPENLREIADKVVEALLISDEISPKDGWQLHPAEDSLFDGAPAELLEGDYRSAWVPLAGGLLLAAGEVRPRPDVWATGAWSAAAGIVPVEGIEPKLRLAAEFGAAHFFLPQEQTAEAERVVPSLPVPVNIESLAEARPKPRLAMRRYLSVLGVRAGRHDPKEDRAKSYLRIDDPDERRRYYLDCLAEDIAEFLRNETQPERLTCKHLVTIASDSPELAYLTHLIFQPHSSLILFTRGANNGRFEEFARKAQELLREKGFNTTRAEIKDGDLCGLMRQFRECLESMALRPEDGDSLVIDVTPGTKLMSLAWAYVAPANARIVYLQHTLDPNLRKPKPFSESLSIYSVKELRGTNP